MENKDPELQNKNKELNESAKLRQQNNQIQENNAEDPEAEPVEKLIHKFGQTALLVNRLDYYANAIPLGAICNAIAFVLLGFHDAKVVKGDFELTYILLIFGGFGQVLTGILEYLKGRTFICTLYMTYGFYFVSFYYFVKSTDYEKFSNVFYGSWAGLTFPIIIASVKTNLFYLIQSLAICAFFVCKCIGECRNNDVMKDKVSGILECIGGFASFYIAVSQIMNEHFKRPIIPCIPFQQNNEIDITIKKIIEKNNK